MVRKAESFTRWATFMKILIVDDEPLIAQTLSLIFGKNGFVPEIAYSADQGLAAALKIRPDLVLCDIDMPGRDGIQLMIDLGRELPCVPILVLTGFYSALDRVRECATTLSQPVSIVTKPCQPSDLLRAADQMLRTA